MKRSSNPLPRAQRIAFDAAGRVALSIFILVDVAAWAMIAAVLR